jgi:hypothetical protein
MHIDVWGKSIIIVRRFQKQPPIEILTQFIISHYDIAHHQAAKALNTIPDNCFIWIHMGLIKHFLFETDEAVNHYHKVSRFESKCGN